MLTHFVSLLKVILKAILQSWYYFGEISGKVYSWGDGDYGKLGRGGSDGSKIPRLVEKLQNIEITNVYCGTHFSVALSKEGHVYTWGKVSKIMEL